MDNHSLNCVDQLNSPKSWNEEEAAEKISQRMAIKKLNKPNNQLSPEFAKRRLTFNVHEDPKNTTRFRSISRLTTFKIRVYSLDMIQNH